MNKTVLTTDQADAVNVFLDFLVNDDSFLVIQGAAGTGKSFLIKHLLETFYSQYKAYCLLLQEEPKDFDIKITATTNKAVSVVDEFLESLIQSRNDIQVCTIYSLLGLKVSNDNNTGKTKLTFSNGKNNIATQMMSSDMIPLVFIDEASFIGDELHQIIESVLQKQAKAKIIYIGDRFQLAPIGQTFSAMDHVKCDKVSLNEIVRNSGHILATGTQFRKTVETGIFEPIQFNNSDVIHVDGATFQSMVENSFGDPKWMPSSSMILAWTNARVQEYNSHIRQAMGRPEMFEVGEVVITNQFIKAAQGNYSRSVDSEVTITKINRVQETNYDVLGYMVEIDDEYVGFMPADFAEAKLLLKKLAAQKDWKKYFEVKDTWLDLRAVYARSIHKAQGSTYQTTFLDLADIGKNWSANDVARLLYVGFTRAAKQVVCYGHLPDKYCK